MAEVGRICCLGWEESDEERGGVGKDEEKEEEESDWAPCW